MAYLPYLTCSECFVLTCQDSAFFPPSSSSPLGGCSTKSNNNPAIHSGDHSRINAMQVLLMVFIQSLFVYISGMRVKYGFVPSGAAGPLQNASIQFKVQINLSSHLIVGSQISALNVKLARVTFKVVTQICTAMMPHTELPPSPFSPVLCLSSVLRCLYLEYIHFILLYTGTPLHLRDKLPCTSSLLYKC